MAKGSTDVVRAARRRREQARQAVIYGVLCTVLVAVALGALAIYTGAIDSPFHREFTQPQADAATTPPCLPATGEDGAFPVPVPYAEIHLRIFNASGIAGLAGANRDVLEARGFLVDEVGDSAVRLGQSELRFGERGIVEAYTLAAQFPSIRLVLDDRITATVDLLVGARYEEPLPEDSVGLSPDLPMVSVDGCAPASRITPVASTGR